MFLLYVQVGENHTSTKESSEYLKDLTQQAVLLQKSISHLYSNTDGACIPPPQVFYCLLGPRPLVQVLFLVIWLLNIYLLLSFRFSLPVFQQSSSSSTWHVESFSFPSGEHLNPASKHIRIIRNNTGVMSDFVDPADLMTEMNRKETFLVEELQKQRKQKEWKIQTKWLKKLNTY